MVDLPRLSICLLVSAHVHDQNERALHALRSTLSNISYDGPLSVHIADGGPNRQAELRLLLDLASSYINLDGCSVSHAEGGGYGAICNTAQRTIHAYSGIILTVDDEWELTRPLDLTDLVQSFFDKEWVGCIRLDHLSWPSRGQVQDVAGMRFLNLEPEGNGLIWTNGPRLETRRFQRDMGDWPETGDALKVAATIGRRVRHGVLWPLDLALSASPSPHSLFVKQGGPHAHEGISIPAIPGR